MVRFTHQQRRVKHHHDEGGQHLQIAGLQAHEDDQIVNDEVDDTAAHDTDKADHEIGLDLQTHT